MTRVIELFHRKTSPIEQQLILDVISERGRKLLMQELKIPKLIKINSPIEVYICNGNHPWCKLPIGKNIAFRKIQNCCECSYFVKNINTCDKCRHEERTNCPLKPEFTEKILPLKLNNLEFEWKYELEKLCLADGKIGGYIDILFDVWYKAHYIVELNKDWIWDNFDHEEGSYRILIECKPTLKTFLDAVRQIKTYDHFLPKEFSEERFLVIATYDKPNEDIKKVLDGQNIILLQIPKDNPLEKFSNTEASK